MTSLRQQLNDLIRVRGEISYNELNKMRENRYFGRYYKETTMMRRLEKSESPDVEAVIEGGIIIKYSWVGKPPQKIEYKVLDEVGRVEKIINVIK